MLGHNPAVMSGLQGGGTDEILILLNPEDGLEGWYLKARRSQGRQVQKC